MMLTCPTCGLAFDAGGLGGRVFCPSCGAPFEAGGGAGGGEGAPVWREAVYAERPRTSHLAVASLVCGLVAAVPGCLCVPFGALFMAAPMSARSPNFTVAPPPMPVAPARAVPVPGVVPRPPAPPVAPTEPEPPDEAAPPEPPEDSPRR